ncbi:MAG: hypothetical protein BRD50_07225 [Bacteroidetes bacterium SW_11_45_7]|nr:MAG: hypothetical protein BRD50_07225 [Bacteroidetes bacterium SW_11_45_7]
MNALAKATFFGIILILCLAWFREARAQFEEGGGDSSRQKVPVTSADTILALPFDTVATPWFRYPYWTASADTLPTKMGLIQQLKEKDSNLWIAGVLVIALLIIGFVRTVFQRYFRSLFQAIVNMKQAKQIYEEQVSGLSFSAFVLNINFLLTMSLFLHLIVQELMIPFPFDRLKGYALIFGIAMGLYLVRYISLKGLYFLFPQLQEADFYNFHFFLVNKIAGIVLIPFLFLIAFSGSLPALIAFYGSGALLAILLFVHFGRGVIVSRKYWQNDVFHFFLYLCVLELAPSLVIIKSLNALFA